MPARSFLMRLGFACVAFAFYAQAQIIPGRTSFSTNIRAVSRSAGAIFRGTVLSVDRRVASRPNQLDTVEISFYVDEGLKGVKTGSTFRIREWVGLWDSRDRYRVGERVALFLYPPSRLGLTSPVGGDAGRYPIDDKGRIILDRSSGRTAPSLARNPVVGKILAPPTRLTHQEFRQAVRRATEQ